MEQRNAKQLPLPLRENPQDQYEIVQMPERELLQDFLRGLHGNVTVIFNLKLGIFERITERNIEKQVKVAMD